MKYVVVVFYMYNVLYLSLGLGTDFNIERRKTGFHTFSWEQVHLGQKCNLHTFSIASSFSLLPLLLA